MKRGTSFSPLPKAAKGNSWVLAWMVPAVREENEFGGIDLCAHQRISLIKCVQASYSPVGLGTIQLELVDIYGRLDADKLSGALAGCTHAGGAFFIEQGIRLMIPDKASVLEANAIEKTLQALSSVNLSNKLNLSINIEKVAALPFSIVMPSSGAASGSDAYPYGLAFVPNSMSSGLDLVDRDHRLKDTHSLCNLLATKHRLMLQLGFECAVALDKRLINNRKEYEEAQRGKALRSMCGSGGRY